MKKLHLFKILFFVCVILLFQACKKENDKPEPAIDYVASSPFNRNEKQTFPDKNEQPDLLLPLSDSLFPVRPFRRAYSIFVFPFFPSSFNIHYSTFDIPFFPSSFLIPFFTFLIPHSTFVIPFVTRGLHSLSL